MDNFALFICGIAITLVSGMGVLVYMVNVGYRQIPNAKSPGIDVAVAPETRQETELSIKLPPVA